MRRNDTAHAEIAIVPETITPGQSPYYSVTLRLQATCTYFLIGWHLSIHPDCWSACREGRGLGFIEFTSPRDAEDAKYGMDRSILDGKEVGPT